MLSNLPSTAQQRNDSTEVHSVDRKLDSLNYYPLMAESDHYSDSLAWANAYFSLYRSYIRSGKLRLARELYFAYAQIYPGTPSLKPYLSYLPTVDTALKQLDSIDQWIAAEDEKLWAKGKTMVWFCANHPCFEAEACYDLSLADSIYRRLALLYPQSALADDADFESTLLQFCYEGSDGSNSPDEVAYWQLFLQKHPETDLKASVLSRMAWALGREKEDLLQGLEWIAEAELLRPELFADGAEYSWIKQELQKQLDGYELDFQIRLNKSHIKVGEPVVIDFLVKNTSGKRKMLTGFSGEQIPNFSVEVVRSAGDEACIRPIPFIESQAAAYGKNGPSGQWFLEAGETYSEQWDITQTAYNTHHALLGAYLFDGPGTYEIRAQWRFNLPEKSAAPCLLQVE